MILSAPEGAPLSRAHWELIAMLVIGVIKPAWLGFTIPGMTSPPP